MNVKEIIGLQSQKKGEKMNERKRLIELLDNIQDFGTIVVKSQMDDRCNNRIEINNLNIADYLIKSGIIVPPCNVGDTVWYITGIHHNLIKSAKVEEIIINETGIRELYVSTDNGVYFENDISIFYFTREEAEKALKGGAE